MIFDQKRRDKVDTRKPQPYTGDSEDLKRFIRQLHNVWVLESHKYQRDITKIRYAANHLRQRISTLTRCQGFPTKRGPGEEQYDDIHPKHDYSGLPFNYYSLVDLVMVMLQAWELELAKAAISIT